MKILVFELACITRSFESQITCEGFEMLNMITEGFSKANHEVTVILNSELDPKFIIKCAEVVRIDNLTSGDIDELCEKIIKIAEQKNTDYVFPIAPDHDLARIVKKLRKSGLTVIASENSALDIAADKWKTYNLFKNRSIRTPGTELFPCELSYPLIVKPRMGVACENLFKINNENEFNGLRLDNKEEFIMQEFIHGDDVSVTLFSDGKIAVPISLNKQNLKISLKNSRYIGGIVPYSHPMKKEAFKSAKFAVESVGGLKGAVGVDIVISEDIYVIEINPRVTTSMVALEKAVTSVNVAEFSMLAYTGDLSKIFSCEFKNNNIVEFSHKFMRGESCGIEFKNLSEGVQV
ncbi:MAG: hypothetical protein CVT90_00745 [Candidatus Altiarchaeales archaeon HGW-Altiarchaeales-3]|nr:MAG: hypothetical protein CVT90_00745 [Candidatus Altiarchaeales archaeon HGW-Altiarchaeales-3]